MQYRAHGGIALCRNFAARIESNAPRFPRLVLPRSRKSPPRCTLGLSSSSPPTPRKPACRRPRPALQVIRFRSPSSTSSPSLSRRLRYGLRSRRPLHSEPPPLPHRPTATPRACRLGGEGGGVKKTMSKPESIHKFPFEYVPELLPAATHSLTVPTSTRNDTHTFSSVHLVEKVFVIRPWSLTNSNDSTESKPRNQEKALADSDY